MERKFFKQNFVHRIIALVIAMIMVVSPLPFYLGGKGNSKAADDLARFTTQFGLTRLNVRESEDGLGGLRKENDYYVLDIDGEQNDIFTIGTSLDSYEVQVTITGLSNNDYTLKWGQDSATNYNCKIEYYYQISSEKLETTYAPGEELEKIENKRSISISEGEVLGLYAKLILPETFTEDSSTEATTEDSDTEEATTEEATTDDIPSNFQMGYVLIAKLNISTAAEGAFADGAKWQYEGKDYIAGTPVDHAKMVAANSRKYLGKVKYLYVNEETYNNGLEAYLANATWSENPLGIGVNITSDISGKYYGVVGYFDENKLIDYKVLAKAVILDVDAPKITGKAILYTPGGEGQSTALDTSKDYYVRKDDAGTFQLQVVVDEEPVVVDFYKRRIDSEVWELIADLSLNEYASGTITTEGKSVVELGLTDQDIAAAGLEFKADVKDKAGNVTTIFFLPKLKLVNETLTIERIALVEKTGETYSAVDYNQLKAENNAIYINRQYYLMVTASSGFKIEEMASCYGEDEKTRSVLQISSEIQERDDEGRYRVTDYVPLIASDQVNEEMNIFLKDLQVEVKDEKGTLTVDNKFPYVDDGKNLWDYFYDETKPVISFYDAEDSTKSKAVDTDKWHQEFKLGYQITQGYMSSGVEARLYMANYSVDDGDKQDILTQQIKQELEGLLDVSESKTVAGTKYVFDAEDLSGNRLETDNGVNEISIKVDKNAPTAEAPFINGKQTNPIALTTANDITVRADVRDNLTLSQVVFEVIYPDGITKEKSFDMDRDAVGDTGVQDSYSTTLSAITGETSFPDGQYIVAVIAIDKSGRESNRIASRFEIDNTAPEVGVRISSGTEGGKEPRHYYYGSNVTVELTCLEKNIDAQNAIIVEDNGNKISLEWNPIQEKYIAYYTVSSEGLHNITIGATDKSGTQAQPKSLSFVIDKTAPGVSTIINGAIVYTESMGALSMLGDTTIGVSVTDMTADANDLNYQVIQTKPGQATNTSMYWKTANRSFGFTEEADYTVNFYAVDMANNASATRSVNFRIDRTAPNLSISGVGGGTSANAATVTFTMQEAFWWDASGTVTIYRKAGDGSEEQLLRTIDFVPTAYETAVRETLTETGVYRMEFSAEDRVGHRVNTSQTFTIDREAPKITLTGVKNYDLTNTSVNFVAQIADDFYSSKKVTVSGTRIDVTGKKNIIAFSSFNEAGNPSIISETFSEDGIYDIEVSSVDVAGNSRSSTVHFIIDKTAPEIGDLSAFDGVVLREFKWDYDLDELVLDLTVCDVHMYLNGIEYDGVSEIEDGSYILLITAMDELGQYSEKSVEFILDTKAPVFIVTGVEDDEVKNEQYDISVSLQLDEDTLTSVTLNGKEMSINENVCSFSVTEEGSYTLAMKAIDAAGNEAENIVEFRLGEENSVSNWWIWIVIASCALLLFIIFFMVSKKYRKNEK